MLAISFGLFQPDTVKHIWVLAVPFGLFQLDTANHIWVLTFPLGLFQPNNVSILPLPLPYNVMTKGSQIYQANSGITNSFHEDNHLTTT